MVEEFPTIEVDLSQFPENAIKDLIAAHLKEIVHPASYSLYTDGSPENIAEIIRNDALLMALMHKVQEMENYHIGTNEADSSVV